MYVVCYDGVEFVLTILAQSDAVVASVADRLGISKATILDSSSDNTAVRVALAETHVIAETKIYFESVRPSLRSFFPFPDLSL